MTMSRSRISSFSASQSTTSLPPMYIGRDRAQNSLVDAAHPLASTLTRSESATRVQRMNTSPIPVELLQRLLRYDALTGDLRWEYRDLTLVTEGLMKNARSVAAFNAKSGGKLALTCPQKTGHRIGIVLGNGVSAHRVAWALATGSWPTRNIDHINGNPADNRLANLRDVDQAENVKNARMYKNNTSGAVGVFARKDGRFNAYVRNGGVRKHLGCFSSFSEAKGASEKARAALGFSLRHGT